jgi:hypothetical protein
MTIIVFFILRDPKKSGVNRLVSGRSSVRIRHAAPVLKGPLDLGIL